MPVIIKKVATAAGGKGHHCPECNALCKTLAGLSKHMNAMHLRLSPNQAAKADRTFRRNGNPLS